MNFLKKFNLIYEQINEDLLNDVTNAYINNLVKSEIIDRNQVNIISSEIVSTVTDTVKYGTQSTLIDSFVNACLNSIIKNNSNDLVKKYFSELGRRFSKSELSVLTKYLKNKPNDSNDNGFKYLEFETNKELDIKTSSLSSNILSILGNFTAKKNNTIQVGKRRNFSFNYF
jgi:hypothetical protein